MSTSPFTALVAGDSTQAQGMLALLDELGFLASVHQSAVPTDRADVGVVMAGQSTDTSGTIRLLLHTKAARRVVVMAVGPVDDDALVKAAVAGADGWLATGMSLEAIGRTLRAVIDGESGYGRNDVSHLLVALRRDPRHTVVRRDGEIAYLTPREHEMYIELAQGMSVRSIAKLLMLSEATIRWHVAQLNKKLNGSATAPPPLTSVPGPGYVRTGREAPLLGINARAAGAVKQLRTGHAVSPVHLPDAADLGSDNAARWAAVAQSERRVARLVAQGLTNQKVADALVLSKHTVDSHLKRIFVKLGVRSRVELTRLVLLLDEAS